MSLFRKEATGRTAPAVFSCGWYDIAVSAVLLLAGTAYLWNGRSWGDYAYIGNDQFGDTIFWWNGALQFSDGVVWTNLNISYRMGYAAFTGLLLSILGSDVVTYHKLLILLHVGAAIFFYFAARRAVGRAAAAGLSGVLVFAPLHAEWLAITTSDATGLIWHLLALSALILGVTGAARPAWTAACGLFLAFGNLTRPAMAPFIVPAALFTLMVPPGSWRRRLPASVGLVMGFALPTLMWMAFLHLNTGIVGLAGQDSTTFYAASDPHIQVWSPTMHEAVEASARARMGHETITPAELSREFWILTVENYRQNLSYHLERLGSHILAIARFSYFNNRGSPWLDRTIPQLPVAAAALLLTLAAAARRQWLNVLAATTLAGAWLAFSSLRPVLVIAAAVLFLQPFLRRPIGLLPWLVSAYWWTGVAALYLVGGTWGPPLVPAFDIDALGYRLGEQFLFANDMLIVLAIWLAATVQMPFGQPTRDNLLARWRDVFTRPRRHAALLVRWATTVGLVSLGALLLTGCVLVSLRGWTRAHGVPVPMPDSAAAIAAVCSATGRTPQDRTAVTTTSDVTSAISAGEPILATGALGALVWQFTAQGRTRSEFYQQSSRQPFMWDRPRGMVEMAGLIPEAAWRRHQGLWLLRPFPQVVSPHWVHPIYLADPQVELFIPLDAAGTGFAATAAIRFPLTQYAAQLAAAGALTATDSRIEWPTFPLAGPLVRWFDLMPRPDGPMEETRSLQVNLDAAEGRRSLSFEFRIEPSPGQAPVPTNPVRDPARVLVTGTAAGGDRLAATRTLMAIAAPAGGSPSTAPGQHADIPLDGALRQVTITFQGVAPSETVRVIELKLIADDFAPTAVQRFCR